MKLFSFKSLRVRLLLLVLFAVIPALGAIGYTASEQRRLAGIQVQRNVLQLAEFIAHEEEQILQGGRQILIALAKFIENENAPPDECNAFSTDLLNQFQRYANLGAAAPDGEIFCSAVAIDRPLNVSDQLWFQRAVGTGGFAVGDYHLGRITGKPVLVLAYPAVNPAGVTRAVVFASLDLQWLNRHKFDVQDLLPDDYTLTLIDENGFVLARQPESPLKPRDPLPGSTLFKQILAQKKGMIRAPGAQGNPYIYTFAPVHSSLRNRQIYVILGLSEKYTFADSNRILVRNLTLLGLVGLTALLAAWFGGDLFILRRIKKMVQASRKVAAGELNARTGLSYGQDELSQLAQAFDEMAAALEQRRAERRLAENELKRSQELFRNLSLHLQEVREEERTRIARQIHDDLGQALTALKIDVSWLNSKLTDPRDAIREKLKSMVTLVDGTVQTVRKVSEDLRPGILDDFGLSAAIEWQAEEFQKRTGIECKASFNQDEFDLSREQSTNLFRIVQEALTNVIRHAEASKVQIRFKQDQDVLLLEVQDNGKGIDEQSIADPKSFGLIGIKERARSMGGEVTITGLYHQGTSLTVKMPISERKNYHD